MKIIISEDQLGKVIKSELGEDYPESWNIEEFKKLNSFNSRIQYCQNHLKRISSGSSRIVYMVDDTKVLKIAKNKKGIAQNEVEINMSTDYMWDGIIAEIYDYDENGLWVEMALARKVTEKNFKEITGVSFKDYCNAMFYRHSEMGHNKSFGFAKPSNMDEMWDNEFVFLMMDIMSNYDLPPGDLCKLNSFGIIKKDGEDQIVMIDYGLNNKVYDSYYS